MGLIIIHDLTRGGGGLKWGSEGWGGDNRAEGGAEGNQESSPVEGFSFFFFFLQFQRLFLVSFIHHVIFIKSLLLEAY